MPSKTLAVIADQFMWDDLDVPTNTPTNREFLQGLYDQGHRLILVTRRVRSVTSYRSLLQELDYDYHRIPMEVWEYIGFPRCDGIVDRVVGPDEPALDPAMQVTEQHVQQIRDAFTPSPATLPEPSRPHRIRRNPNAQ